MSCTLTAAPVVLQLETIGFEHVVADLCCVTAAYHVLPHNFYRNCSQRLLARRAAAALLREVTEQQAYRPTADASAWQSAFLGRFAEAALQVDQVSIAHKGGRPTSFLFHVCAYLLRFSLVMSA